MSAAPTFSIVTPSFGQLEWLELCIASVADQDVAGGVEHVVCDAGSPGIEDFIRRMQARFPARANYRLQFEVSPDRGMYDAINKGLRLSTGTLCAYLNCDEQYLPMTLARVVEFFREHLRTDVVFGDALLVDPDGEALCYWRPYVPTLRHLAGATLNTLSCATFFRKHLVDDGHLFDPDWKAVSDMLWVRELIARGVPMRCLPLPLSVFTYFGDNLGGGELAAEEVRRTRSRYPWIWRQLRRALHGFRKWRSGAFVLHDVNYAIFTRRNPMERCQITKEKLGWQWPSGGDAKRRRGKVGR